MILRQLYIVNFKSIKSARLNFSDNINCFVGNNGMGKTNLLDAIHYLSFTKSHLGLYDSFAINNEAEFTVLDAVFQEEDSSKLAILLQIKHGSKKILKKNKKDYDKMSDHIGRIPLVIVSPFDNQLVIGPSELRRKFIDQQLSQQNRLYMSSLVQYNRALEQRNTLLKSNNIRNELIRILDMQMAEYAKYIFNKRREFVAIFTPIFNNIYHSIDLGKENVSIEYQSQLLETNGDIIPLLNESFNQDKVLGFTSTGIHKDDLVMNLGNQLIRKVGSQGQTKTFLISLKLAQYRILDQFAKTKPILLLDDIFDRLDSLRVERIIELVSGSDFGQIFITDTNRAHIDEIIKSIGGDFRLFNIEYGNPILC